MATLDQAGTSRLWRAFAGPNRRDAWQEWLGLVLLGAGAGAWWRFGAFLSLGQNLLVGTLLVVTSAVLHRRGWLRLFGPVLLYDLIRLGRRERLFFFRTLYAGFLMFLLCWIYLVWLLDGSDGGRINPREMAGFSSGFFYLFLSVQFVAVLILTPAYTAGAIAEEKERQTLEFLLATDLRSREIVLSRLVSRLANLTLFAITGLPVLSLLQFLGGVDPNLVLAGYAVTGLTMASLAGLSILTSVWCKKPRDAITLTFLVTGSYLVLTGMGLVLLVPGLGLSQWVLGSFRGTTVTLDDVVGWLNTGNIIAALIRLDRDLVAGARLDDTLPGILRDYALFHGAAAVVCAAVAVWRMRPVAIRQLHGTPARRNLTLRLWGHPPVGSFPVLWKEVFAEPGLRVNWFGRVVLGMLILASILPGLWIAGLFLADFHGATGSTWEELGFAMNVWVRVAGTIVSCLLLMAIAVRAASTISGERDRQTYDSLLTSPLEGHTILFAKWLGSILSVRWLWLWPGAIWAIGIVTSGLQVLAVPLLMTAWFVYAGFAAALGMWFSLVSRTSLRATVWTLLSAVVLSVGHWFLMMMCAYVPLQSLDGTGMTNAARWVLEFHVFGLTPPATFCALALQGWEFQDQWLALSAADAWRYIWFSLVGILCWAVATAILWRALNARFVVLAHRLPFIRPEVEFAPPDKC